MLALPPEARGGRVPRIEVHPGFVLYPVKTPTLAPATHTNCIVIGGPEVLIVDPGSPYEDEQELLERSLDTLLAGGAGAAGYDGPRQVKGILVTHHHADHWGGVARLKARYGVPVYAHAWSAAKVGADTPLEGGETIALASEPVAGGGARAWRLGVLFTPGHTPGHLALWEPVSGTIVAGDLVSGLSTVVVDPPEGDMAAYVASLARLAALPATLLLPGHGPPIGAPAHRLAELLEHRAWRERKVLAALTQGPRTLTDVVPDAYDDTPAERHALAARSALAHLFKLKAEGRVEEAPGGKWRALEPPLATKASGS
jgi:glyoxylase-like metal-dependent hydrolase (beta-lactamase superfamily II)